MKGCKVCGMPHSSAAHQKVIRSVGGYVGGQRDYDAGVGGSKADRINEPTNQTIFLGRGALDNEKNRDAEGYYHAGRYPVYPEPQSIRSLPPQLAGYTDEYNLRGQVAALTNVSEDGGFTDNLEKFLSDVNTVYINPLYKTDLYQSRLPADRLERKAENLRSLDEGIEKFAAANSKYFDKQFVVLPKPKSEQSNVFNDQVANPMKTLQLDIQGFYDPKRRALASVNMKGMVNARKGDTRYDVARRGFSNYYNQKVMRNRGVDADQPVAPYTQQINMNFGNKYTQYQTADDHAFVLQHEFGHNLGREHSTGYRYDDANTVMSYDSNARYYGAKLLPSDINLYRAAYKAIENKRKTKNARGGVAKNRK